MPNSEQEFTHESLQDRDSIVHILSAVGDGLHKGNLVLSSNGESFSLQTPPLVKFDVEAKQKRSRGQLVLKLSWKNPKSGKELRIEPLSIEAREDKKAG